MKFLRFILLVLVAVINQSALADDAWRQCNCDVRCIGYDGPGGPCFDGPGGPRYAGPGGPLFDGPGGACFVGPGGPMYTGPGGAYFAGPGGPLFNGPGGPCFEGPGGPCFNGPGGTGEECDVSLCHLSCGGGNSQHQSRLYCSCELTPQSLTSCYIALRSLDTQSGSDRFVRQIGPLFQSIEDCRIAMISEPACRL